MPPACRLIRPSRLSPLALALAGALLGAAAPPALAGELTVAWSAAGPAASTRYRVFVGDRPGVYDRVVDAGTALHANITDLEDGRVHYLAVKAVDAAGHESPDFSPELACMPRPRVESVEPAALAAGGSVWVTLRGSNFDRDVQVRSNDPALRARAVTLEADGSLSVLVEAAVNLQGGVAMPTAATFSLAHSCRRADSYFEKHPQTADVDGSGAVDGEDVRAVSAAIGARRGENRYSSAADVDADGIVDGRDLDRVISLSNGARPFTPATPAPVPAGSGSLAALPDSASAR